MLFQRVEEARGRACGDVELAGEFAGIGDDPALDHLERDPLREAEVQLPEARFEPGLHIMDRQLGQTPDEAAGRARSHTDVVGESRHVPSP